MNANIVQNYPASLDMLQATIQKIKPVRQEAGTIFAQELEHWLPSEQGLGALKDAAQRYVAATNLPLKVPVPATIICCADHGVAQENVSAYPPETTLNMATNYLISKGAAANAFANFIGSGLLVADLGINADTSKLPGLLQMRVASGTQNSAQGPAMTREQAITAICHGITLANMCHEAGATIMLPGEMGISNTTASAAITAAVCQLPAEKVTGRGTNISDQRLQTKRKIVAKIIELNQPDPHDALDVMAKVGGFELAAITGIILGAAANQAVTILDGFNTGAAALIAASLCPEVKSYLIASHQAGEQGHPHILQHLELKPVMKLELKLGEAIGSTLMADLLMSVLKIAVDLNQEDSYKKQLIQKIKPAFMAEKAAPVSEKTFNFYTNTMPDLDTEAMEKCQQRLDNLAKPIYCLGTIERIVHQLSGIISDQLPAVDSRKGLLLYGLKHDQCVFTYEQGTMLADMGSYAGANVTIGHLQPEKNPLSAFDFGRQLGEKEALRHDILGIGLLDLQPGYINGLYEALVDAQGNLRYAATEFLGRLSADYQLLASALLGTLLAAPHNGTMLVLDDKAAMAIARYAVQMCPALEKFLLPIQPTLYQMDMQAPGLTAFAGIRLVTAALHVLNDMKTFAEAQVAVANDGPGAGIQK